MKSQSRKERNRNLKARKSRIGNRLGERHWEDQPEPMFGAQNIHYEMAVRDRGLGAGGIGAMQLLVKRIGLAEAIDRRVEVLKAHLPYHESDHVLNIAYNVLAGGTCLEDLEIRRNNEVYLDALGAQRIPDPTTAGDFCRRLKESHLESLMTSYNDVRLTVWKTQPKEFFEEAVIDADGVFAETHGECKAGMGINHDGQWGYHPLLISLANTQEPLYLVNRPGNRPSHEGAAERFDAAIHLCHGAGFARILLRGDTDFSQAKHLDGWDERKIRFIFGFDAKQNLIKIAEKISDGEWTKLRRKPAYEVKTQSRERPDNEKERIVVENEYTNIKLQSEQVAEFDYKPTDCKRSYRMIVLRKNLSIERGEMALFDDVRYFFYITNDRDLPRPEIVYLANRRCNQENLIDQLKNGIKALRMPTGDLLSNWAYMVIASLAWSLKAWFALMLPDGGRWAKKHEHEKRNVLRMEFKKFLHAFMLLPAQIVRTGRKVIYRLMGWGPYLTTFFRGVDNLRAPLRC